VHAGEYGGHSDDMAVRILRTIALVNDMERRGLLRWDRVDETFGTTKLMQEQLDLLSVI